VRNDPIGACTEVLEGEVVWLGSSKIVTDSLQRTKTDAPNRSSRRDRVSVSSMDNGLGPIGDS
jgi:hypothetical protein